MEQHQHTIMALRKGLLLIFLGFIQHNLANLSCPERRVIEFSTNASISCTSDREIADFYWYKGDAKFNDIIGSLVNGNKFISEHYLDYYDVNFLGELVIIDAALKHESHYTLATFDAKGVSEEDGLIVNITVRPNPPYPKIDVCPSSRRCNLLVNSTGTLTCSIVESRPQINLQWQISSNKGFSFTRDLPFIVEDVTTTTWNTSVRILYETFTCDQEAALECVAHDDLNSLDYVMTSVRISEQCSTETLHVDKGLSQAKIIVIAVASSASLLAVFIASFGCYIRNKRNKRYKGTDTPSFERPNTNSVQTPVEHKMTEEVLAMISRLKKHYKSVCSYKTLSWEDPIPVDELYAYCKCEVIFSNGEELYSHSGELLTNSRIRSERQVLLTGEQGCGKTMVLRQLVKQWVDEKDNDFILIFASLSGATQDMKITDVMKTSSSVLSTNDIQELEKAIHTYKCLIILDEVEKMSFRSGETLGNIGYDHHNSDDAVELLPSHKPLTIQHILNTKKNSDCINRRLWITIRDTNDVQKVGLKYCKIKLTGFSEEQIMSYIKQSYLYYLQLGKRISDSFGVNDEYSDDDTNGNPKKNKELTNQNIHSKEEKQGLMQGSVDQSGAKCSDYPEDDVCKNVYIFLEEYDIIRNFKKIPQFLVVTVHFTLPHFVFTVPYVEDVSTWNIAKVLNNVVLCLISNYTEHSKVKGENIDITCLTKSLEDKALQSTFENMNSIKPDSSVIIDDKILKHGVSIGFFKQPSDDPSTHMMSDESSACKVTFCQPFLDYFAACNFVKTPQTVQLFKTNVSQCEREKVFGFVKFISKLETSTMKEMCDMFMTTGWFNNVIDCLYVGLEQEEEEKTLQKIKKKDIKISYLESSYHRNAVKAFCKTCTERNVTLASMSFLGEVPISFLEGLPLSSTQHINFIKKDFTKKDFVLMVKKLTTEKGGNELSFFKCAVEDGSSLHEDFKNLKGVRPTVYKQQHDADGILRKFNYETGEWDIGAFGKILNKIMKDD